MLLYVFVDTAERFPVSPYFETEIEANEWARREWPDLELSDAELASMPDVELVQVGDHDD